MLLSVSLRFVTVSDGQQSAIRLLVCLVLNLRLNETLFELLDQKTLPSSWMERNQTWQAESLINRTFENWVEMLPATDTPRIQQFAFSSSLLTCLFHSINASTYQMTKISFSDRQAGNTNYRKLFVRRSNEAARRSCRLRESHRDSNR